MIDWLIGWLIDWLIGWLIGVLTATAGFQSFKVEQIMKNDRIIGFVYD